MQTLFTSWQCLKAIKCVTTVINCCNFASGPDTSKLKNGHV